MAHYVLICGGRDFDDGEAVFEVVAFLKEFYGDDLRIMHGGARGADTHAQEAAEHFGVRSKSFPADWETHGKKAGPIRNREMADFLVLRRDQGNTVQIVAFPGGFGTGNMVMVGESLGIDVDLMP